ncbi:MAG: hypothetical protein LRY76_06570 [Alphaproteobacteria bacterium]|nr:hypothetical protein [Alphaproteobacteria bacterium]
MIKKTGPLAAAALASIMGSQALAAESPAAPPAQNTKFTTVTGSFCPQGTPRETAYINISFNAHKDGMTDAEAQSTYRSDIVSLTRKTWKKTMQGYTLDQIIYRPGVYQLEPHRYKAYSEEKERAFWDALQTNLKDTFNKFKAETGVDAEVKSTLILIQPGCLMGG